MFNHLSLMDLKRFASTYWQKILLGFGSTVCFQSLALPSQAQITQATIQEILDGNQVYIQTTQARLKDRANFGQVVLTKNSRTGLIFNNGAAGRLGNYATVTVGQCVELKEGELLVSGPVNGCVAGLTVIVEGTLYVLQKQVPFSSAQPTNDLSLEAQLNNLRERVDQLENEQFFKNTVPFESTSSSINEQSEGIVKVLNGKVRVRSDKQPQRSIEVVAGQKISIRQGVLSPVTSMTSQEIRELLNGELFSEFQAPIISAGTYQAICRDLLSNFNCPINDENFPLATEPMPFPSRDNPFPFPFPNNDEPNYPSTTEPVPFPNRDQSNSPFPNSPETSESESSTVSVNCQSQVNNYLTNLKATLGNTWNPPKPPRRGLWQSFVTYTITRNGKVQNLQIVQSSGYQPLDEAALEHVRSIERNFPSFPRCYQKEELPVDQTFKVILN